MTIQRNTAWEDVFSESARKKISRTKRRINVSEDGNYHVSFSSFSSFVISDDYSGVIAAYNVTVKMYIETSFFRYDTLTSALSAGTIYFMSSDTGEIALNKICLGECYTKNELCAIGFYSALNEGLINHLNMSATCNNGDNESIGYYHDRLGCGKIVVNSLNSSYNKCYMAPGLQIYANNEQSLTQYCCLTNNTAKDVIFCYFSNGHLIKNCVMCNNMAVEKLFYISSANVHVYDSIFLNNAYDQIVVGSEAVNIILDGCYCDDANISTYATINNSRGIFLNPNRMIDFDICNEFMNIYVQKTKCIDKKISFYIFSVVCVVYW